MLDGKVPTSLPCTADDSCKSVQKGEPSHAQNSGLASTNFPRETTD
jgi:hypothetical protein